MESPANHPAHSGRELRPVPLTRRRSVRQKVHIPAYANLNGSRSGMVLDLNEIVDISEDGMCIQTSTPLTPNRSLPVSLDLAETKAFIHTTGLVVWTNKSGRAGLKFRELPPQSRHQLQEWLFANTIAAFLHNGTENTEANRSQDNRRVKPSPVVAISDQEKLVVEDAASREEHALAETVNASQQIDPPEFEPAAPLDYTALLTGLTAVQREVETLASDQSEALRVMAGCALTFTRATGAAIALSNEGELQAEVMTCVAVAGCDAPPLDSHLHVGAGFSGECVRSRTLLSCEDAETDSRVDHETCRALGIRSMIAVPVILNDAAVGLLEVFSPDPHAFAGNDCMVLDRLAKMIAGIISKANEPRIQASVPMLFGQNVFPSTGSLADEANQDESSVAGIASDKYSKALLIAAAVTLLIVLFWLFASHAKGRTDHGEDQPSNSGAVAVSTPNSHARALPINNLEDLRKLAVQGDPTAEYALGVRYATGEEVKQDDSEAFTWFTKAAEQGSVPAQATLGAYYWAGRGVPQDLKKAYFWAVLAQAGGDVGSKYRTAVLASRLSRSQIIATQQQADDWIKDHKLSAKN